MRQSQRLAGSLCVRASVRRARLPVGGREHDLAVQPLERPAVRDEPGRQVVQQFRMRRPLALRCRNRSASPTSGLPKCQPQTRLTITRAASGAASVTIRSASSSLRSRCGRLRLALGEDGQEAARHGFAGPGDIAADEYGQVARNTGAQVDPGHGRIAAVDPYPGVDQSMSKRNIGFVQLLFELRSFRPSSR